MRRTHLPALLVELSDCACRRLDLLHRRSGAKQHLPAQVGLDAAFHAVRVLGRATLLTFIFKRIHIYRRLVGHVPRQPQWRPIISGHPTPAPNRQGVRAHLDVREGDAPAGTLALSVARRRPAPIIVSVPRSLVRRSVRGRALERVGH